MIPRSRPPLPRHRRSESALLLPPGCLGLLALLALALLTLLAVLGG